MADFSLDDEFVVRTRPSTRFPAYTRANVGEVWAGPATPLTSSSMSGWPFEHAWRDALVRIGAFDADEFDPDNQEMIGVFYGYMFLNLSVQRVFGVRMPGASADIIDASFFGGGATDVPPYVADPRDESPRHTEKMMETIGWSLSVESLPQLDEQRAEVAQLRAHRPDFSTMSDLELFRYAEPIVTTRQQRFMHEHMFITAVGSIPIGLVTGIAAALGDPGLAVRAIAGLGEVDSAAPVWSMWDLSRLVNASAELRTAFDSGVDAVLDRLRASGSADAQAFLAGFDDFLRRFGSRCVSEWDLGVLAWESDPKVPLTSIQLMRAVDERDSPVARHARLAADREAASQQMLDALAGDEATQGQLRAGLRAAALWLPARERSKTTVILQLHEAREALQELGRRMVAAGHFDHFSDFNMLMLDEFVPFIADPGSMAAEVRRRRAWHDELWKLDPPFNCVGMPPPSSQWRRRVVEDLPPVTLGETITGIGACPGTATGRARVILDPADGGRLEPGDVMITPGTDPAWTPLFVSVEAVVVDVGAPLSHAAIVSRELGVPCVVSATHASRRIPDGALVSVDGGTGVVTILEMP